MTRWPYLLIAILCIPLSGCLTSMAVKGDQSAINRSNEVDRVFKASLKKKVYGFRLGIPLPIRFAQPDALTQRLTACSGPWRAAAPWRALAGLGTPVAERIG